ncbi:MAG: sulfatase-like hydrolase/transferase [Planctomycetota bacterium]
MLKTGILGWALLVLACASPVKDAASASDEAPPRPNILILVADDLSWLDLDLVPTPNIDRLAARGVSFESMYSNPVCSTTRITCLLGSYSYRENIGEVIRAKGAPGLTDEQNPPMGFGRLTLAEFLKSAGYATLAAGKSHLANEIGGLQTEAMRIHGFDHFRAGTQFTLSGGYSNWFRIDDGRPTRSRKYNTTEIARAITSWWGRTDGPKFCWGAFNAPHKPFHAPPPETLPPGFEVGNSDRAMYEAMIMAMDHEIGNILQTVDLADTIVVFMSDNGTPGPVSPPGVNPNQTKGTVFDAGVRVPFIIAGPGFAEGATRNALVNTTDMYATFAERVGVPIPEGEAVDSVSMLPYLLHADAPPQRDWVYSEYWVKTLVRLMARNRTHKLIDADPDGAGPRQRTEVLFRMEEERQIPREEYTDEDRAALEELRAVLAGKGPKS